LIVGGAGACNAPCAQSLHATRRRARSRAGKWNACSGFGWSPTTRRRIRRCWRSIPDLLVARVSREALAGLPAGAERIYVIDPLGNLVLAFPADPDIKRAAKGRRAPAPSVPDRINPAVTCKMSGLPDRRRVAAVARRAHSR
jgi:hypothetical protein